MYLYVLLEVDFPMTPHVRLLVGRSVGLSIVISWKFHFHAPFGALFIINAPCFLSEATSTSLSETIAVCPSTIKKKIAREKLA